MLEAYYIWGDVISLKHYLVTQADTLDGIRTACADLLLAHDEANREEGLDPWDLAPPPADAIAEIRALPGSIEFELSYEPRPTP